MAADDGDNGTRPKRTNPVLVWGVSMGLLVLVLVIYVVKAFA